MGRGGAHREPGLAQAAHEGDLFGGGEAGQVEPVGEAAVLVVVALLLDLAERGAAQAVHLDNYLRDGSRKAYSRQQRQVS